MLSFPSNLQFWSSRLNMLGNCMMSSLFIGLFLFFHGDRGLLELAKLSLLYVLSYYFLLSPLIYFLLRRLYGEDILTERLLEISMYMSMVIILSFFDYKMMSTYFLLIVFLHIANYLWMILFGTTLEEAQKTRNLIIFSDIFGFVILLIGLRSIFQSVQFSQEFDSAIWIFFSPLETWSAFFQNTLSLLIIQGLVQLPADLYLSLMEWKAQRNNK